MELVIYSIRTVSELSSNRLRKEFKAETTKIIWEIISILGVEKMKIDIKELPDA